jgi:hypothetical protein
MLVRPQAPDGSSWVSVIAAAVRKFWTRDSPSSSHRYVAAALSDCSIISVASCFSVDDSDVCSCWCQYSSAARIVTFMTLAE